MARPRYPSGNEPLPPPLPPGERTVGQLVAEAIRLYGQRFWPAVLLGLPVAVADQLELDRSVAARIAILCAFAPLFTLAYAAACTLVSASSKPGWNCGSPGVRVARAARCPPAEPPVITR